MDPRDTRHTRIVTWLKILLPLAALGLLSTVFLLSRPLDPGSELPFADPEIIDRAAQQQVTGPRFSGVTDDGDLLNFRAESARPDPETDGLLLAEGLQSDLALADGGTIALGAARARVSDTDSTIVLQGDVHVTTSTGYDLRTEEIVSSYKDLSLRSTGPVSGTGPPGSFVAGAMDLRQDREDGSLYLHFTDGIKLVYDPRQ